MTLTMEGSGQEEDASHANPTELCTNGELRLRVVRTLWTRFKKVLPSTVIGEAAETLLASIMCNHSSLLNPAALEFDSETSPRHAMHGKQAREEWVSFVMDILSACDADAMKVFWGFEAAGPAQPGTWGSGWSEEFRVAVWKTAVECWREGNYGWEPAVVLLGVPFTYVFCFYKALCSGSFNHFSDRHAWDAAGDDFTFWSEFYESYVAVNALDYGLDSYLVIDKIASFVLEYQSPGHVPSALRFVDYLLSLVEAPDMRDVPANFLDLISQTMRAAYPPEPRKMQIARWLMRSLSTFIEGCPDQLIVRVLEVLEESLVLWIQDEYDAWNDALNAYDVCFICVQIFITC